MQTAGLAATDDITFSSTINGAQALTLTAGAGDVSIGGAVGGGTPLTSITASGNTISLQAVTTMALGANVSTAGNVLITAGTAITRTAGTISGNGTVLLDAATGVGTSGARINTSATTLAARTTTSGGIFITETDAATIGTVTGVSGLTTTSNGNIDVNTTNGTLTISQAVAANGAGTVTLAAGGAGSDLTTSAVLSSTSGAINLTGADDASLGANVTTAGPITLMGTSGTVTNTATINTSSGNADITVTAGTGAGLTLGNLNAGAGTLIVNTGSAALDIGRLDASTLTGSALTVTAGDMTTASSLAFTGALTLNPTGTLTVTNTVSATGAVTVNATGAVTGSGGLGAGSVTPSTASRNITIGDNNASDFALNPLELSYLTDGFSSITIGRASDATGTVTLYPVTFNDPVTIVGGSINVSRPTSLSFNGSSDFVDITSFNGFTAGENMTLAAWVRPTADSTLNVILQGGRSTSGGCWDGGRLLLSLEVGTNNKFTTRYADGVSNAGTWQLNTAESTTVAVTGTWYYLVSTYDGSNAKLYVNGALEATTAPLQRPESQLA